MMLLAFADAPDWLTPLMNFGVGGICLAFFMWRDAKRDDRDARREEKRDVQIQQVVDAMHCLTRAISLEVSTRPTAVERSREEARSLTNRAAEGK